MDAARELDPVDLAVLWDRLISITDEGSAALVRTSFSTLVREGFDLTVLIFDAKGRMIAQSTKGIPVFIGTARTTLSHMLSKYPGESLDPGDVVVSNDPTFGTGHMFDIAVMRPIHALGQLVGYAMSITHLPDIGGMGFSAAASEIYHEGLRLPVSKLYRAGQLNDDLVELLKLNVRVPEQVLGDIFANVTCIQIVARQVDEFLREYDLAAIDGIADAILANSDQAVRRVLLDWPDATYVSEAEVEAFGETRRLACRIDKAGDSVAIDFAGSGPCVRAGINVPFPYARAMALYAFKCLTTPSIPNNDGSTAAISVSAPPGCILNALPPSPSAGRHTIGHFVVPLVFSAIAPIVPEGVSAASGLIDILTFQGRLPDGRDFSAAYSVAGGFGALSGLDGRPCMAGSSNMGTTPVEVFEPLTSLTIERKALRPDSGGPGEFRGGPGQTIVLRNDSGHDMAVFSMANRTLFPAEGLFGGGPGALREHWIEERKLSGQGAERLAPGERLRIEQAGGGGYGPPEKRPREKIGEDIERGFLTPDGARRAYGI